MKLEALVGDLVCSDCGAVYANVIRMWNLQHRCDLLKDKIAEKYKIDNGKIVVELWELIDDAFKNDS